MSLFQSNINHIVIGPKSLGYALWYFSSLCMVAELMFSLDYVLSRSWDAVLDAASDSVRKKFLPEHSKLPRKQLSKILKSIIINQIIVDESADEIVKHFSFLSEHIGHFYPIDAQFNRACSWLRYDPHLSVFLTCTKLFGTRQGHRHLYSRLVRFSSKERLFELQGNAAVNSVHVSQLTGD
jgi:hypothetical protein